MLTQSHTYVTHTCSHNHFTCLLSTAFRRLPACGIATTQQWQLRKWGSNASHGTRRTSTGIPPMSVDSWPVARMGMVGMAWFGRGLSGTRHRCLLSPGWRRWSVCDKPDRDPASCPSSSCALPTKSMWVVPCTCCVILDLLAPVMCGRAQSAILHMFPCRIMHPVAGLARGLSGSGKCSTESKPALCGPVCALSWSG